MNFKSLNIIEPILRALENKGYISPTPIQEKTIPLLLGDRDVIGIAQTGTGKTAAFVVPILQKLYNKYGCARSKIPRALILAPTRELAAQIEESFIAYGKFLGFRYTSVYGGVSIGSQMKLLERGIDVLIATPGRLMDLMNQKKVNLRGVEFLVLDEADRMLDMGFLNDVKKIISVLPVERQSLFFSATMSKTISDLAMDFLKDPARVEITPQSTPVDKIDQCVFFVDQEDKNKLLMDLIKKDIGRTLIFVGMKHKADKVVEVLARGGIRAEAIHGNKSQIQRTRALDNFKSGKSMVLVATDIAARGIDVKKISHVINYDLPNEPENYIHRIGRTARAGKEGIAYSFCSASDRNFLNQIERITKKRTPVADHRYHSVKAKSAEGADARPAPRIQRGERGRSSRAGGSRGSGFSKGGRVRFGSSRVRMGRTAGLIPGFNGRSRGGRSGGRVRRRS
jgi:ATP-dependent RNA helicase RhlE